MTASLWTLPGLSDRAAHLWTQAGLSTGEIAADIEARTGREYSPQAVFGRLARMGLSGKGARRTTHMAAKRLARKAAQPIAAEPAVCGSEPKHLRLSDLRPGQCRFACTAHDVAGDQHRFCGAPRDGLRPYCADHARLAYRQGEIERGEAA